VPGIGNLSLVVIDCPDPSALADFYGQLTGWKAEDDADGSWSQLKNPDGGITIAFQQVADFHAPDWPGQGEPQQFHLDVDVPDLDEGERAVLAVGATKAEHQPGTTFRVFLDPAGHPFCLVKE
jgi:predicted enzyme related to lactoylglutathione lyase